MSSHLSTRWHYNAFPLKLSTFESKRTYFCCQDGFFGLHSELLLPVVMSWLMPSTEMVALEMGLPCRSRTKPLTPRWTCEGKEPKTRSFWIFYSNLLVCPLGFDGRLPDVRLSHAVKKQVLFKCASQAQTGNPQNTFIHLYLLNVADQWVAVLVPVGLERVLAGELVAAELQSDLKAVAAEVVEILHSCGGLRRKGVRTSAPFITVGHF